jgi:hypothetical protein
MRIGTECGFPEATVRPPTDSRTGLTGHSRDMAVKIDISRVSEKLAALHAEEAHRTDHGHRSIAIVLPLGEGRRDVVAEFVEEGPPFDPSEIGLSGHKVFLTDREAIFVFETDEGVKAFDRLLAEPDLWEVLSAWEHCLSDEPRLATAVYEWPKRPARTG